MIDYGGSNLKYTTRDSKGELVQAGDFVRYVGETPCDFIQGVNYEVEGVTPIHNIEVRPTENRPTYMMCPSLFVKVGKSNWEQNTKREVMTTNDKFVVMFADDEPKILTYIDIVEHINKGWINLEEDIIYELGSKIDVLLDVEFRQVHNSRS